LPRSIRGEKAEEKAEEKLEEKSPQFQWARHTVTNQIFRCHFTSCTEPFLKCWQGHNTLLSQMAKGNLAESGDMCVGGGRSGGGGGWRGTTAL